MSVFNKVANNINRFTNIYRRDGAKTAFYVYFYDMINRVTPFSVYRIMRLQAEKIAPDFNQFPPRYSIRVLTDAEALEHAKDPRNDMTVSFVQESIAKGETCYGIFDGNQLSEYGWFSDRPCHTRRELYFFFDNKYKYQHKGFTYPEYRGQRLHAFGKAYACRFYAQYGYKGVISIVEAHNLNSLRSNMRMGAEMVGSLYAVLISDRYRTYRDSGSRQLNCYLGLLESTSQGSE